MEDHQKEETAIAQTATVISPKALLAHWQGHRNLTRRLIEAFPEDKLFTYTIGGMRPFSELVMEMLAMGAPGTRGIATGEWDSLYNGKMEHQNSKEVLLRLWDKATEEINNYWSQISPERFQEEVLAFGQYEDKAIAAIFYFIDNEIHHRGQGYVYLRSLGIAPPPFWER